MNSKEILYSSGGNDECYTPLYGVLPILKYIPKDAVVWCPFDTEDSHFVKEISKTHKVIFSHIGNGQDFYTYEPKEKWDVMVSNPPFTGKRKIFERALSFGKPFALLMTLTVFNDKYPSFSFYEVGKTLQLLKFDKRIKFISPDGRRNNKITFSSGYICCSFLPKDLIMEVLDV